MPIRMSDYFFNPRLFFPKQLLPPSTFNTNQEDVMFTHNISIKLARRSQASAILLMMVSLRHECEWLLEIATQSSSVVIAKSVPLNCWTVVMGAYFVIRLIILPISLNTHKILRDTKSTNVQWFFIFLLKYIHSATPSSKRQFRVKQNS